MYSGANPKRRYPNAAVIEDPKCVNSCRLKNQNLWSPQLNPTLTWASVICIRWIWIPPLSMLCCAIGPLRCIYHKRCFSLLQVKAESIHWKNILEMLGMELLCKTLLLSLCYWRIKTHQSENWFTTEWQLLNNMYFLRHISLLEKKRM